MTDLGKILLGVGVVMVIVGAALWLAGSFLGKVPWIGRLPGDIYIERPGFTLYFPIVTSVVVSVVLSLLLYLFRR